MTPYSEIRVIYSNYKFDVLEGLVVPFIGISINIAFIKHLTKRRYP